MTPPTPKTARTENKFPVTQAAVEGFSPSLKAPSTEEPNTWVRSHQSSHRYLKPSLKPCVVTTGEPVVLCNHCKYWITVAAHQITQNDRL